MDQHLGSGVAGRDRGDQVQTADGRRQGFDFIKSPVQIGPMWLHQPKRLAGLTLLIMLAVLLAALLGLQVRPWLAKQGKACRACAPGQRRTALPTAEALLHAFADYSLVVVQRACGRQEVHLPKLRSVRQKIWNTIQLPPNAELNPAAGKRKIGCLA